MSTAAITVENLWKQYRLGTVSHRRLAKDFQSWWARVRGKEDPNSRIHSGRPSENRSADDWFWALREISFEVKNGEVLGIIGRNGAGKSTLLKILSRVTTPTQGQITITGRVASLLEVGTGFHPELTGRENVYLNGAILGMSKVEIRRKFDEIIAFSEVEKFVDTPVKRYSSGMYVRLAFGVAAHLEPEILIIDEVLAVGDAAFQKKCLGKMEAVGKEGRTVLFVSHNMPSVQKLCSRALLLEEGRISRSGNVSEVVNAYLNQGGDESLSWERTEHDDKPAYFKRIYAVDGAGCRKGCLTTGDQLRLAIELVITVPSAVYRMSVALQDELGTQIFSTTPQESGLELPTGQGTYIITVSVPGIILLPKLYGVRVILWRRYEKHIDTIDTLRFIPEETISLETGQPADRNSLIAVPCEWNIAPLSTPD
jgi:lipopolysaccharide transport system ATP-binding protein